jgi:hypothetical protein
MPPVVARITPGLRRSSRGSRLPWALAAALLCGALLLGVPARAQSRFWTDQDGRRYDASIISFYKNQLVTFRRPDGRTFTLALNDLVPNDQMAVREWLLKQPEGVGEDPPPNKTLSTFGRAFVLDEPRVLRLQPFVGHGYPSAFLGVPVTVRSLQAGPLEFVNVYFYDEDRQRLTFPLYPPGSDLMLQDDETTSIAKPEDFKSGQTYTVLFPIRDPVVRLAPFAVIVAGNANQVVATVYPEGSWRDFDFPEHDRVALDPYADYSGEELYSGQKPAELFDLVSVTRLKPANGATAAEQDFFRLSLRFYQPFPAAALAGRWYAFGKDHQLLHAEDLPPYAVRSRKDGLYILLLAGSGPADVADAVPPTEGQDLDTVQLPGGAWWDRPDVDSLVFVFGTETKKVAQIFSKSDAAWDDLPVPEKAAFGDAVPATQTNLPTRSY